MRGAMALLPCLCCGAAFGAASDYVRTETPDCKGDVR